MRSVWTVAVNAISEVRHRRVLWIAVVVGLIIVAGSVSPFFMMRMAREAGESQTVTQLSGRIIEAACGAWGGAAFLLAIFLGATAVSSEVRSRTIVRVLARPLERWEYLVGRWAGIVLFALGFFVAGTALSVVAGAFILEAPPPSSFWLGLVAQAVSIVLATSLAVGFGAFLPGGLAGTLAIVTLSLSALVEPLMRATSPIVRALGRAAYVLAPAEMPEGLIGSAAQEMVAPRYGLFAGVLTENLLYGAVVLLLAAIVFHRREIRLSGV